MIYHLKLITDTIMATKERKQKNKKTQEKNQQIIIYVVTASMLLSGIYFLSERPNTNQVYVDMPDIDAYKVQQLFNLSMIVSVKEIQPELIAKVDDILDPNTIKQVKNTSISGLKSIVFEVGNPIFYEGYSTRYVGGAYMLFKFRFSSIDENETYAVQKTLDQFLGKGNYRLMLGCVGKLPINVSGPWTDEIYLPCDLKTKAGDYFRVIPLAKQKEGYFVGTIGFITKKVAVGPTLEAEVVNVSELLVRGVLGSDYRPNIYELAAEEDRISVIPPTIVFNTTLSNKSLGEISRLDGVKVSHSGNDTKISFNNSHAEIIRLLERDNVSYSLVSGSYAVVLPLDAEIDSVEALLNAGGVTNITYMKVGVVSLPPEVIIDGKVASIPESSRFNALLRMKTQPKDKINVSLTTIRFGEDIYVIDAREAD